MARFGRLSLFLIVHPIDIAWARPLVPGAARPCSWAATPMPRWSTKRYQVMKAAQSPPWSRAPRDRPGRAT